METNLNMFLRKKTLVLFFESDLKFEQHIAQKVKKANQLMGLIRRSFSYLDCRLFKQLYTTFVRPHLEYAQAVWAPHLRKHVIMLENVQKRATKLVDDLKDLEYPERLRKVNLPTLIYRRARGDMIEIYKHFHTYDKSTLSSTFKHQTRTSRKHNFQLVWKSPKDGVRGVQTNSFYYRTMQTWNNLPAEVVNASNIDLLKKRLGALWKEHPMKYNHNLTDR